MASNLDRTRTPETEMQAAQDLYKRYVELSEVGRAHWDTEVAATPAARQPVGFILRPTR